MGLYIFIKYNKYKSVLLQIHFEGNKREFSHNLAIAQ